MWNLDDAWDLRSRQVSQALRDLNAAIDDARARENASRRAREGAAERNAALGRRVDGIEPRIVALVLRVDEAKAAQGRHLAEIAVRELEEQRRRLDDYAVQARYALAAIYDGAKAAPPAGGEATP